MVNRRIKTIGQKQDLKTLFLPKKNKGKEKMQKNKNKTLAILIVSILMFSMVASMTLLPSANGALKLLTKQSYAYVGAMPNPVGIGQKP